MHNCRQRSPYWKKFDCRSFTYCFFWSIMRSCEEVLYTSTKEKNWQKNRCLVHIIHSFLARNSPLSNWTQISRCEPTAFSSVSVFKSGFFSFLLWWSQVHTYIHFDLMVPSISRRVFCGSALLLDNLIEFCDNWQLIMGCLENYFFSVCSFKCFSLIRC